MNKDYTERKLYIEDFLKKHISEKRRKHIRGVRETAIRMAEKFGADPEKAEIAALYHDMFKERDLDDLVLRYGLGDRYLGNRNLAHSKVAAAFMEQELGFRDPDLLNAVRFHTTGRPGMSLLEQILYLADACEPNRDYPGVEKLRELAFRDLDEACLFSLARTVTYVREQASPLDEDTLRAKEYYEERIMRTKMDNLNLVKEAAKALDERRGENIIALNVTGKSSFADYIVIAEGGSDRQTEALADNVEDRFAELGQELRGSEGWHNTGWILLDFGDIVVNVFTKGMREKYNLESVWGDCEQVPLDLEGEE